MYERFYGFKERPFSLLPDPDFLFLSDKHRMALDLLELAIFNQAGFCVISGEIGAGKTTLIRELLNRLGDDICVGLVSNTHPSFGELLQWITAAYDLDAGSGDQFEQHKCFLDFVIQQYAENKRTLLIIDEAQNLSISAMEELRMLSNVNSERDLVLQVILVGQNQLREKLQQPELEQFAQRISVDYHLAGLDERETRDYIRHRLTRAGGPADVFTEDACRTVYRCSEGIPRLINGICDICLVYGYSDNSPVITPERVREVVEDQRNGHIRTPPEQITTHGGDATMTAFGSTLADGIQVPEQSTTAEHSPYLDRADRLISQVEDVQGEPPPAAETAYEEEYPTGMASQAVADTVPETIVGSMEGMLLRETGESTAANRSHKEFTQTDTVQLANRHRPVVDGGQGKGANGESRPVLVRMFMGLVLLTGIAAAGWLAWDKHIVSLTAAPDSAGSVEDLATHPPTQENVRKLAEQREAERLERERETAEKRLAEQREAERLEREREAAEKRVAEQREAERLEREREAAEKRLAEQREAERLERERETAEKRLAEQREAERLERERREAEKQLAKQREMERLERERQAAQKRLAELRKAQRLERERKAAEKRLAEQREAQRLERERQEIEKRLAEQIEAAESEARRAAALSAWKKANSGIEWSEEIEEEEQIE